MKKAFLIFIFITGLLFSFNANAQINENDPDFDPYEENLPTDSTLPLSCFTINYGFNVPLGKFYSAQNLSSGATISIDFLMYVFKNFGLAGSLFYNDYSINTLPYKKQIENQFPGAAFNYNYKTFDMGGFLIGPSYGIKKKKFTIDIKLQFGAIDPSFHTFDASRIINGDTVIVETGSDAITHLAIQPGFNLRYNVIPRFVILGYFNYFIINPKREFYTSTKLTGKEKESLAATDYPFINDIRFGIGIGYSLLK